MPVEFSHEVVELSHEFLNDTVVGVDMAGDEDAPCTKQHIDAFRVRWSCISVNVFTFFKDANNNNNGGSWINPPLDVLRLYG